MRKLQLKTMLLMLLMAVGGLSPAWAADKTVVKYSFDDALSPSLTVGSRVSFDYDKTSVITSTKFLNAWNNENKDPVATTVSLGNTDLSGETWTLSFEWAACGGCNKKPDHTTLKAGDTNLFDLTGNSDWNTTVTITYAGSDGTKTLPVPGCDKNKRFTAAVGNQLNTTAYWHHIVVTGSASGVKMTITNSSTGTAVVEDVVLSETNVNPTSLIIEPCCGGAIGIDELSLTYFVEGEVIQTPIANYTAVNGIERTITATCDTKGATLYYSTDGENWTEGASITVSASGNVYFKAVKGNSESDVLTFAAVAGEAITLNAPTIVRSDNTTVTISADQTNLLLSPTATIKYTYGNEAGEFTGSKTLTVAADATITAYAEATGYTTSATSERAVALFPEPEYVDTVENTPTVIKGTPSFAFSAETITVSEREYAALLIDGVQWGTNVYLQNLTITDPIVWGIRNGNNWYINTTDPQWILIRNLKANDIVVVDVTSPAADMVNATYSEKLSFGSRHAYVVEADGDVELDLRKTNAKEMQYFYGVYAYRENSSTVAVTGITLNETSASLTTGDVLNLTATIEPDDATDKTVTWISSDETVATVSEGVVTTLKAGTATITATANGGTDVTATCVITVTDDPYAGEHYIYSAADGKFLSRGADWGTRAIADNYGVPANVTLNDGVYNIQFLDNLLYLGSDGYADKAINAANINTTWTLETVEGGFKLKNGNGNYAKITDGNVNIDGTAENATVWSFKTIDEQKAIVAATQQANIVSVATANGWNDVTTTDAFTAKVAEELVVQDQTALIKSATAGNIEDWTYTQTQATGQYNGYNTGDYGAELFRRSGYVSQTITVPEAGIYKLTLNAFYREGSNAICQTLGAKGYDMSNAYVSINDTYFARIPDWYSEADGVNPDNTGQAKTAFEAGKYAITVYAYVGNEKELTIKLHQPNWVDACWMLFNNFALTYYAVPAGVAVESVSLDKTSATIALGDAPLTLTATVLPDNADDKNIIWTSSDETVATVANGVVTALNAGTATITATSNADDTKKATCEVTVTQAAAPSFYSEIAAGDFYIMNAATGKFLGGDNAWGTQASLIKHGIPFTAALNDGKYTLDSHTYNDAKNHFLNGVYVDQPATNLYITSLGSGKYSISTADGSAFISAKGGTTVVDNTAANANSSLAQWYFISKNDRDKMLVDATAENPVDATYYIPNASFSRNQNTSYNENKWTVTADNSNLAANENCAESYCSSNGFNVTQTITVPNGTYRFRAQGFYRQEGEDNVNKAVFFIGDKEIEFPERIGSENNMASARASFDAGLYYTDWTEVTVTDHTLTLGARTSNTKLWCIWDNFELEMIGYTPVTEIAANIDKTEFEIGQTATISDVTVTPAAASFTGYSFSTSDEAVATVDANGVVTGVAEGDATITVKAEMENVTKTFDVTVVKPAVDPTGITLAVGGETVKSLTVFINKTATIAATVAPAEANQAVTFASSNEAVVTVSAEGVVTPVAYGTANITVTSAAKAEVTAVLPVTITAPLYNEAENLDFAEGPVATTNVVTYDKDKGTGKAQMQEVTGWTIVSNGDARAAAVFEYNSGLGLGNASNTVPASGPDGTNGYVLGLEAVWDAALQYTQPVRLPAGAYTITLPIYNQAGTEELEKNLIGFVEDGGTEHFATTKKYTVGSWTTETIKFVINSETFGKLSLGYDGKNVGNANAPHLFIDRMTIAYEPFATAADYAALNTAIEAKDGKTLGFDKGEYAPYNNADVLQALAAAKAINQEANNAQSTVQAATDALDAASWSDANTEEVNAFFDGSFEHDYSGQTGNVQPLGWYRNEGTYSGDGYNVRYVTIPTGVEGNTSGHGLFGKFTMMYGKQTGYTLPLKAGIYAISFMYGGYGEKGTRILKLYNEENEATVLSATTITAKNNEANSKADAYSKYDGLIQVPADGDYVFSFYRENTSSQNQIAIVDIKMMKAVAENITIAEGETYTPALKYANVTFNRTLVQGWNGLVLPFDMTVEDVADKFDAEKVKNFTGIKYNENAGVTLQFADFAAKTVIHAGTPFLVKVGENPAANYEFNGVLLPAIGLQNITWTADGNDNIQYTMTGTYAANTDLTNVNFALINGTYFYYHNGADQKASSAKAFRAYFENKSSEPNAARVSFDFGEGETTGITDLAQPKTAADDTYYDLQGRKVETFKQKGIYILNGRKVVK